MTFSCTEAIIYHMEASGPQDRQSLYRYCKEQAVPFSDPLFKQAIDTLLKQHKIVLDNDQDSIWFDLPPSYYEKPSREEKLQSALWDLLDDINYGREFPDAAYATAQRHKVEQLDLEAAYDEYCNGKQALVAYLGKI